ncbi:TonB-dependent siderophore receptor [Aliirhizobium smilacinae]|uniref:TonB-dependent siderophore receptor n=1 Tax=Aliirhizobium smilacinae TaxID=1395944 RepID=A0A5C4XMG1_9HYPH|nr:TonB-dependent siderophore receptor [Rhizobium smilacinae]TNM63810.1 TonB-dependent siderophore receptor [Rhizobium smilacinae]
MNMERMSGSSKQAHKRCRNSVLLGCTALIALAPTFALSQEAGNSSSDTTLAPITLTSNKNTPGSSSTSAVKADGYVGKSATLGTKTDTDLSKVPQSISIISRKELEDRNVQSLVQAANYSSGVRTGVYGFDPRFDTVFIRGFNVTSNGYYRDGLRDIGGNFSVARKEPYGLEAVSILKGPSSVLYGGGSPGGLVNVVSKRPTDEPFNEVEAQLGNFDRRQVSFDSSGPVAGNDNVLYRITGLARDADTQFIAAKNDRIYIAPALTFRSDDRDTQLTILGEYSDITSGGAAGYVSQDGARTDLESGDPAWADLDQHQKRIGYEFQHRFSDNLEFRQNLRYQEVDVDMKYVSFGAPVIIGGKPFLTRTADRIQDSATTFAVDNQLEWNVATGALDHTVLGGMDYSYLESSYAYGSIAAPFFDYTDWNYGEQPISGPTSADMGPASITRQNQYGIYLQDQIEFNNFVLTLGGRYDWLDSNQSDDVTHFSKRIGLAYLFDNGISPYVSYSTSFAPNSGRSFSGAYFAPSEGEQFEVGVKYRPTDLNLAVNAAIFNIEQTNTLASDPDNIGFQVSRGKVRSRGFEIEAKTSLFDGLDLLASYTYLDLEILAGDNPGKAPSGLPTNQFTLWANYQMPSGPLEGLSLGAGARYYSKTWKTDENNTGKNDARVLVDASVGYDFGVVNPNLKGLSAKLNVSNVFDNRETTCAGSWCYVEEGRTVMGSLRYRF